MTDALRNRTHHLVPGLRQALSNPESNYIERTLTDALRNDGTAHITRYPLLRQALSNPESNFIERTLSNALRNGTHH